MRQKLHTGSYCKCDLDPFVLQTIPKDIRLSYSKLWLAMLRTDVKGMQKYAEQLKVGDLFDLFACMLTARSWKGVTEGIQASVVGEKEVCQPFVYICLANHIK